MVICFPIEICMAIISATLLYLNAFAGAANYEGDLQDKIFSARQAKIAISGGIYYRLNAKIILGSQLWLTSVTADDKFNGAKTSGRNLNFTSRIYEGHIAAEYDLRDPDDYAFTPYVFAGFGLFHFNPTTKDAAGNKYYLSGMATEGEGFYNGRKAYKLYQVCIPFGGGIKYALSENNANWS